MYHHPNKIWVSKRILFIPPGPAGLQAALKKKVSGISAGYLPGNRFSSGFKGTSERFISLGGYCGPGHFRFYL
jgi:hypothetical protein